MTLHYTQSPSEQVCEVLERLSEKIVAAAGLTSVAKKVLSMKRAK